MSKTTHPIFDKDLMFYENQAMTATLTSPAKTLYGGKMLAAVAVIPEAETGDAVKLTVEASPAGAGTYNVIAGDIKGAQVIPTGGIALTVPFILAPGKWDVRIVLTATVNAAPGNFGNINAGITNFVMGEWERGEFFD
jgi:hypothetical protein